MKILPSPSFNIPGGYIERVQMITELESIVTKMFEDLDNLDVAGVISVFADQVQWVDEFTRKWTRGSKDSLETFFSNAVKAISTMESKPSDFHTVVNGDSGFVTFFLTQTYTYEGNDVALEAPTTIAFVREGGAWKVSMLHSIPLS
jgi:SnoaL-like domain